MSQRTRTKIEKGKHVEQSDEHSLAENMQPDRPSSYAHLLTLQQAVGNQAVDQLLLSNPKSVPPIVFDALNNNDGLPLDLAARTEMESLFQHDFSQVRVHTDASAVGSANAVNALAYTVGNHIVFGTGQLTARTSAGKRLLAHELTHVIQQSGRQYNGNAETFSQPGEPSEKEAQHISSYMNPGHVHVSKVAPEGQLQRQTNNKSLETAPGSVPNYDSFSNAEGFVTSDEQWLALFRMSQNEEQLEQIYQDSKRELRAEKVWQQLELFYHEFGYAVAESNFSAQCSTPVVREFSPSCNPDFTRLNIIKSSKPGPIKLRDVFTKAYQTQAKKLGIRNDVIMKTLNAILALFGASSAMKGITAESTTLKQGIALEEGNALKGNMTPQPAPGAATPSVKAPSPATLSGTGAPVTEATTSTVGIAKKSELPAALKSAESSKVSNASTPVKPVAKLSPQIISGAAAGREIFTAERIPIGKIQKTQLPMGNSKTSGAGDLMHDLVEPVVRQNWPNVQFKRTPRGVEGPDMPVISGNPGFDWIEIKPNTLSGVNTFVMEEWGKSAVWSGRGRLVVYDATTGEVFLINYELGTK